MENRNVVRMVYLSRKSTSEHTGHDILSKQVLTKESIIFICLVSVGYQLVPRDF